jgi:hypothetical protein
MLPIVKVSLHLPAKLRGINSSPWQFTNSTVRYPIDRYARLRRGRRFVQPKILIRFERYHRASIGDLYQKLEILVEVKMSPLGFIPTQAPTQVLIAVDVFSSAYKFLAVPGNSCMLLYLLVVTL